MHGNIIFDGQSLPIRQLIETISGSRPVTPITPITQQLFKKIILTSEDHKKLPSNADHELWLDNIKNLKNDAGLNGSAEPAYEVTDSGL